MGAYSYWRECHTFEAHCGWNVPVGVAKPRRPDEIAHVYLCVFGLAILDDGEALGAEVSVENERDGRGRAAMVRGTGAAAPAAAAGGADAASRSPSASAASGAASGLPTSKTASATEPASVLMTTFPDDATCGCDSRLSLGLAPLSNA